MSKLNDKIVSAGQKPELSPNPDGSGFIKQKVVSSLPVSDIEENVLYIVNGVQWKYRKESIVVPGTNKVLVAGGWERVLGEPNFSAEKGERGTPVHENQAPKKRPLVYNEPVALNGGVTINGKKLEDYIDSEGGVTEHEMETYVAQELANVPVIYEVSDIEDISQEILVQLKAGDIVVQNNNGKKTYIVTVKNESTICLVWSDETKTEAAYYYLDDENQWYADSTYETYHQFELHSFYISDENGTGPFTFNLILSDNIQIGTVDDFYTWLSTIGEIYGAFGHESSNGGLYNKMYADMGGSDEDQRVIAFEGVGFGTTVNLDNGNEVYFYHNANTINYN